MRGEGSYGLATITAARRIPIVEAPLNPMLAFEDDDEVD
jgi:hypothetical protein